MAHTAWRFPSRMPRPATTSIWSCGRCNRPKRLLPNKCRLGDDVTPRLAAMLLQQVHISHRHATVHCFAHPVAWIFWMSPTLLSKVFEPFPSVSETPCVWSHGTRLVQHQSSKNYPSKDQSRIRFHQSLNQSFLDVQMILGSIPDIGPWQTDSVSQNSHWDSSPRPKAPSFISCSKSHWNAG